MTLATDIQALDPGMRVTLFELDISEISGNPPGTADDHLYFHNGTNGVTSPIVWQGNTYQPFPIEATGFETTTKGTLPRPHLKVSNVTGIISALLRQLDDVVGAKVIRRQTLAQFLDGQPNADPNQHFPDDMYFIESKVNENKQYVEWELSSALDFEGEVLPARPITVDFCTWEYRKDGCLYAGTNYFDVNDQPVATADKDVCSKRISGCKCRFGASAPLPFGSFPGARTYQL